MFRKKISTTLHYMGAFLLGAFTLSFFSIFQKRLLGLPGISPDPKGYVVPVLFGGFAALVITFYYFRLQNKHLELEDYLDHIDNLVQIVSADKHFIYVNKAWLDTLQYSLEEVKAMTLGDILHPDQKEQCQEIFNRIFSGESVGEFDTILTAKDGSEIYVRGTSSGDRDGEINKTRGVFKNLTTEHEAEEFERLSTHIFSHTQEGLLITDSRGNIISTNHAFTKLSGFEENELLNRDAKEIFLFTEKHEKLFKELVNSLREELHWQGELWVRKKNGNTIPVHTSISGVTSRNGTISHYFCLLNDISQRKEDEKKLKKMAWYDPLTQLPNRPHFHQLLENMLVECTTTKKSFALFFLDLDGFKNINDQYGHAKGDELLQAVARRLTSSLREVDAVARLGGDEFGILLQKASDREEVKKIAEKLAAKISAPYNLGGLIVKIAASIGVSFFPQHQTLDDLLKVADHAMYEAKKIKGTMVILAKADQRSAQ